MIKKFLVAGLIAMWGVPASAMELDEFVSEVIQTHPELLQRVRSYRQMVEDEKIAAAKWRPTVEFRATGGSYDTNSPTTGLIDREYESYDAALTLTQNLYNGRETRNSVKQARARMESERQRIIDDADNIAIEAIRVYVDVIHQRELNRLAKRNVDAHEYILQKVRERSNSGVGRKSNEEQTLTRLALARAGLIAQQNNLQDALTKLHYFLGRYVSGNELVRPPELAMPEDILDNLTSESIQNHPAMKSAYLNISAAEYDYKRVKSSYLPKVDLKLEKRVGENIDGFDGPTDEHSITLELSYTLYNGGANSALNRQKMSRAFEHKDFSNKVRRQIIQSLRLSWTAHEALTRQLTYLNTHKVTARNTLHLYREEFVVGRRDLLDLLDAEGEYYRALIGYSEAYTDKSIAEYRVYEGMGRLFEALDLNVGISDKELKIVSLNVTERDEFPFDEDIDRDQMPLAQDHCDNSLAGSIVNSYGCQNRIVPKLDYQHINETVSQRVEQLNFEYDSSDLMPESEARLATVIAELKKSLEHFHIIEIYAHSDGVASDKYNDELSQRRAEFIQKRLVASGMGANRIRAFGRGKRDPIVPNDTEINRAKNRRVEFIVKHVYAN